MIMSDNVSVSGKIQKMKNSNFKKKGTNLIITFRKKGEKTRKSLRKKFYFTL